MKHSVYALNKGVNRSIEFKGLKAQYIWWLGGGLVLLLILFALLYVVGVNTYICLVVILVAAGTLFTQVYRMSNRYGEHGLMKRTAKRLLPTVIKCHSRELFIK